MKTSFFACIVIVFSLVSCQPSQKADVTVEKDQPMQSSSGDTANVVTTTPGAVTEPVLGLNDAEKILGEPAVITENNTSTQANIKATRLTYKSKAAQTEKSGGLYFLLEEYKLITDAKTKYSFIQASNENNPGFKPLTDVGDEAYYHSDGENFYFIMARKGTKVVTMKVNKITKTTSEDAFMETAKAIVTRL
jgi:hypothetical protein